MLANRLKEIIKAPFRPFMVSLSKKDETEPTIQKYDLFSWIKKTQNIKTVIDIGAFDGEFAAFLTEFFQASETLAFEPLPSCQSILKKKAENFTNFKIFNVALSDYQGSREFYENSYKPASSLLRVSNISKNEFPETSGEKTIRVEVRQLDDMVKVEELKKNILVKIDVQGMEDKVIQGGGETLSAAQCILIEMSFVPIYEEQALFEKVHDLLIQCGFHFGGIKNQIDSPLNGQPLFAHCLYIKGDK